MNTQAAQLAVLYLAQLEEEAKRLPADQAAEMVADIREHIAAATAGDGGEARTRDVLDRLGSPRALVNEALGDLGAAPTPPTAPLSPSPYGALLDRVTARVVPSTTWSGRETTALVCLIASEVGFIVFPLAGVAWLWGLTRLASSRVWTSREKVLAYATLGIGFPLGVVALIAGTIALPLSVFKLGQEQVCSPIFNPGGGFPSSSGELRLDAATLCNSVGWSPSNGLLTTLAAAGVILLIAQIFAVWKLLQARHRTPAA